MVKVTPGTSNKANASKSLAQFFEEYRGEEDSFFYTGYPIIGTANGPFPIDAVLLSPNYGMIIFDLIEGREIGDIETRHYEIYNKMEARLKNYKELTYKRNLTIPVTVVSYAPIINDLKKIKKEIYEELDEEFLIFNKETITEIFDELSEESVDNRHFEKLMSVIQSISTIKSNKNRRKLSKETSRGSKLKSIEESIANLDQQQSRAVIETVDGVQRIRGLAGSGKTIVLALKAAYLHAQHPDWKIAVTFNTRALKDQIRDFITTFYIEQTNQQPDWDNLQVIHAWGAPGGKQNHGLYYKFSQAQENNLYKDFKTAKEKFGYENAFRGACEEAINNMNTSVEIYDAILVDEAQDFSKFYLRICYEMLSQPKRLVYAYDELQNLSEESLPSPEIIFGNDEYGTPKVKFDATRIASQDIILEKCYRNPRPTLVTAHALGFGIYREEDSITNTGLVQMFENRNLWLDIGYRIENGILQEGNRVKLARDEESSPKFLETHSRTDDLIQFKGFDSIESQTDWLVNSIINDLRDEELNPTDIIVINPDPLTTRNMVGDTRSKLFNLGIRSHIAGLSSPDKFYEDEDSITFTGIYRAKGNEAGMVYIINAQDCYTSAYNLSTLRNRLFTAITRSKAWVRVLGVGKEMEKLTQEYLQVKEQNFTLNFNYPTKKELENINSINRDMSESERLDLESAPDSIKSLNEFLSKGLLKVEDIEEEEREALLNFLMKKNDKND